MRYYGGKSRHGKQISEILKHIVESYPEKIKGYIEPFCGALGVLKHMTKDNNLKCYASDINRDLILLWKDVQTSKFKNPNITKTKWKKLKYDDIPSSERAFAGFGCSFGGQWFSGYINNKEDNKKSYTTLKKIQPLLENVCFSNKDYIKWNYKVSSGGYLIYCDPPYYSKYNRFGNDFDFDHVLFKKTITEWVKDGNVVVVSETSKKFIPKDFIRIWEKSIVHGMGNVHNKKENYKESLYVGASPSLLILLCPRNFKN